MYSLSSEVLKKHLRADADLSTQVVHSLAVEVAYLDMMFITFFFSSGSSHLFCLLMASYTRNSKP
jgi:hypothetical protein